MSDLILSIHISGIFLRLKFDQHYLAAFDYSGQIIERFNILHQLIFMYSGIFVLFFQNINKNSSIKIIEPYVHPFHSDVIYDQ